MDVNIRDNVASIYWDAFSKILKLQLLDVFFIGGRNTFKSVVCMMLVGLHCITHSTNGLVITGTESSVETKLINPFIKAMGFLGLSKYFKAVPSKKKVYILNKNGEPSGYIIHFDGCYNYEAYENIKSTSPEVGNFGILYFEELTTIRSEKMLAGILNTFGRGGNNIVTLYSANTPHPKHWVANLATSDKQGLYVHWSNYLDVVEEHPDWVGDKFIREADYWKAKDLNYYKKEFLGKLVEVGGTVFNNIHYFDYKGEYDNDTLYGMDFGHEHDPTTCIGGYYDEATNSLYLYKELYIDEKIRDVDLATKLKEFVGTDVYNSIIGDCASGSRIDELVYNGVDIVRCHKGKGSVKLGVEWLARLDAIYIYKDGCPNLDNEFCNYDYKIKNGEYLDDYSDKDNHTIDSTRYMLENYIFRGVFGGTDVVYLDNFGGGIGW